MSQPVMEPTTRPVTRWRADWPVALGAAGVGALVWVGATQVAGVQLAVRSGSSTRDIGVVSVIVTALVVGGAASLVIWLMVQRDL